MTQNQIFQSVGKTRLSGDAARQIAQAIHEGRYLPGAMLPPERELTAILGISRPILREALRMLETQGMISIQHGRGAFILETSSSKFDKPLRDQIKNNLDALSLFYEARMAIEPECAYLAAKRGASAQIDNIRQKYELADAAARESMLAAYVGLDIDFHASVAQASGNQYLMGMLDSLIHPETDFRQIVLRLPDHLTIAQEGHLKILKAIEGRKPDSAKKAMKEALLKPLELCDEYLRIFEVKHD